MTTPAAQRTARWRARRRDGVRRVNLHVEIAPGIVVVAVDIAEAEAEEYLTGIGLLRAFDADSTALVDEAVRIAVTRHAMPAADGVEHESP